MALSETAQRLAEIMNIQTTNEKQTLVAIFKRLEFLGHTDCCTRCGGYGQYSFHAMYGTVCFGCNGAGSLIPTKLTKELETKIVADIEAGKLEPYFEMIRFLKLSKNALKSVMNAWTATGISEKYDWQKACKPEFPEDKRISEINALMAREYDRIQKLELILYGATHRGASTNEKNWMSVILATETQKAVEYIKETAKMI